MGKPLYPQIRYCTRCCLPETTENIIFDDMGICRGCISAEQKMHINWKEREKKLRKILDSYRGKSPNGYDCIVPISGGKDSTFQLHILCNVYKMRVLTVTFNHNWFTETGRYNLQNALEKFNVDHIMFTPNRSLVNRLARHSLYKIGDPCWHCHAGVGAFPLSIAVKFKIPLLVWGESAAEHEGRFTYFEPVEYSADYFREMSAKLTSCEMANNEISKKELRCFDNPTEEELEGVGVYGIHLGNYIFWDGERQVEFIKKEYGWKEADVENTYKRYKSVECIMEGVHSYAKYIKRGYGRSTDYASTDVRAGLLTREEGFELIEKLDTQRPKMLDHYLKISGLTEEEFVRVLKSLRKGKAKKLD
ncbi:MAG: LPS biosynthesis protein [Omnitrophica bacterium RBG_13_46_9]|nr:MAG: LPS biosynthesis protein [Omnitrophica bacterium RBG_13_46_9]